ncbi:uncharacterized protein si:dkey-87o1.2 [Chelmon rostratus]|uniref:uncharacterized protein si:dkey-87o1.2 n=1 Tax=Chelmon rostratus TaxID=109905 RepID=UPI001BEA3B73|nr:uncharacterized protein si:dkey-87o1.2 [Chelmon rostratus]
MKFAAVLVCLSVAVMVAMILQAVRQEMSLRELKTRMVANSAEVKKKEQVIAEAKAKISELKTTLDSVNAKMGELKRKKMAIDRSTRDLDKNLQTCKKEKGSAVTRTTDIEDTMTELRANHEVLKMKAEEDIQSLKQQILDRDKAICAFADATKEEARRLCGIAEAPK